MDLAEKYVYHVYMAKNFTKAAKLLYISQPSLSAAVAAKEKELGFRIFNRSTRPISLTPEGEIYIEMLEGVMRCENDMMQRLNQMKAPQKKKIVIVSALYISYYLVPTICSALYHRYPDISVAFDICNNGTKTPIQKLENHEADVDISYYKDDKKYQCYPLFEERVILTMHKSFLTADLAPYCITKEELLSKSYPDEKVVRDSYLFRNIPFLSTDKSGNISQYMQNIFAHYTLANYRVIHSRNSGTHFNMMCAGIGALLSSDAIIEITKAPLDDICFFVFPKEISTRTLYALVRKNEMTDDSIQRFLDVATQVSQSDKRFSLYYP